MNINIRKQISWFKQFDLPYEDDKIDLSLASQFEENIMKIRTSLVPLTNEEAWVLIDFLKAPLYNTWSEYLYAIRSAPGWPFNDSLLFKEDIRNEPLLDLKHAALDEKAYVKNNYKFPNNINNIDDSINEFIQNTELKLNDEELTLIIIVSGRNWKKITDSNKKRLKLIAKNSLSRNFSQWLKENRYFEPELLQFFDVN